jgi:hypothetical protein
MISRPAVPASRPTPPTCENTGWDTLSVPSWADHASDLRKQQVSHCPSYRRVPGGTPGHPHPPRGHPTTPHTTTRPARTEDTHQ